MSFPQLLDALTAAGPHVYAQPSTSQASVVDNKQSTAREGSLDVCKHLAS